MSVLSRNFGLFAVSAAVCALAVSADAATRRVSTAVRPGAATSTSRMPTMPTLPMNAVGNFSTNTSKGDGTDAPGGSGNGGSGNGGTVLPDEPEEPGHTTLPECPDGGVRNSEYTVDTCMNDIQRCINDGALPKGMNSLFDQEVRHAVVNGMGLCYTQVERCIDEVRRNCKNVYRSMADVWLDFNSRKIQPEYYNFVLRKTGLTPNQAENTCRLLDKNTYGPSFSAVANEGATTAEYNNTVGAYNRQNDNSLVKANPQGVQVNDGNDGVDGARGHYARWDAENGTCLIRVAAYNKDKHISNSWLFGAVGDDTPAEVWKAAGETFTCDKDLFGFSLMNQTKTAAVVGVGGGTVLGASIGAMAGHGKRELDCSNENQRKLMMDYLKAGRLVGVLSEYLTAPVDIQKKALDKTACEEIVKLFDKYHQYETTIAECGAPIYKTETPVTVTIEGSYGSAYTSDDEAVQKEISGCANRTLEQCKKYLERLCNNASSQQECDSLIAGLSTENVVVTAEWGKTTLKPGQDCTFQPLRIGTEGVLCQNGNGTGECRTVAQIKKELNGLSQIFDDKMSDLILNGEKSNRGKTAAIGGAVGAGTGGLATAITAFVERNNITCRVGDGLNQVGFKKSHSIDSLRNFYVKWNLNLPDVIIPTATAKDCQTWVNACSKFTNLEHCAAAQLNYKPDGTMATTLVSSACSVSGSTCIENYPVARSYGACE